MAVTKFSTSNLTGLKYKSTLSASGIKGSGGTVSFADGYWIHTFTSDGTFTVSETMDVEYLVVAGGGGSSSKSSGCRSAGGGGAGGYLTGNLVSLTTGVKTVTVGGGGAGASGRGSQGTNSVFGSLTSIGGGGGSGVNSNQTGGSGGSGGGGGGGSFGGAHSSGGAGTAGPPRQGFNGGSGVINAQVVTLGGGGGGAGSSGGANGAAGAGVSNTITGESVTYAQGGSQVSCGAGSQLQPVNSGYGARGSGTGASPLNPGASGIVIVRYLA